MGTHKRLRRGPVRTTPQTPFCSQARRMAETADDIPNDLVMASFEIVEGEYDEQFDRDGEICAENTRVWRVFDGMCERFAEGYQPKGATEFVRDLVAGLTGEQGNT